MDDIKYQQNGGNIQQGYQAQPNPKQNIRQNAKVQTTHKPVVQQSVQNMTHQTTQMNADYQKGYQEGFEQGFHSNNQNNKNDIFNGKGFGMLKYLVIICVVGTICSILYMNSHPLYNERFISMIFITFFLGVLGLIILASFVTIVVKYAWYKL